MSDERADEGHQPSQFQLLFPGLLVRAVLLGVIALLLQFGIAETLHATGPSSPPADATMAAMHDHGCSGDECTAHDCPPQQCHAGGSAECHCPCGHASPLTAGMTTLVATAPATVNATDTPGSAHRRLENPFRPPA